MSMWLGWLRGEVVYLPAGWLRLVEVGRGTTNWRLEPSWKASREL